MKNLFLLFLFQISILSAQKINCGGRHSLAICENSSAQSWGYNGFGQHGTANKIDNLSGTMVNINEKFIWVAGGLFHSIFVNEAGDVWTCGRNVNGPLGDGSNEDRLSPVKINSLRNIIMARGGGEHSLFLDKDGVVYACGKNDAGQLGIGTVMNINVPVKVNGLPKIISIDAGAEFSLFLAEDGSVWSCGHNGNGQLGLKNNQSSRIPLKIPITESVKYISCGEWHSIFVMTDGSVMSCGRNNYGQLGIGNLRDTNTLTRVLNLSNIIQADAGGIHTVFVEANGKAWSCGLNSNGNNDGQLGDGTKIDRNAPVEVISTWGSDSVTHAEAAREHSLFLTRSGQVYGTGRNNYGQLGIGKSTLTNFLSPTISEKVCNVITSHDDNFSKQIQVYPNPVSDNLRIEIQSQFSEVEIKMIDVYGKVVRRQDFLTKEIRLSSVPNGLYLLTIRFNDKFLFSTKICKAN